MGCRFVREPRGVVSLNCGIAALCRPDARVSKIVAFEEQRLALVLRQRIAEAIPEVQFSSGADFLGDCC